MKEEDCNKSLEYLLNDNNLNIGQVNSYFVKITSYNECIYYGRLDVELGKAEELDDHCDQCFNEPVQFFCFNTNSNLCDIVGIGFVGLKKFNYFKNDLYKILPNVEIIDVII